MQVTAESRWFWRDRPPPGLAEWFRSEAVHGVPAGGGGVRTDVYLRERGQTELGIKRRGGRSAAEVKCLVHVAPHGLDAPPFAGPIETWTKAATGALDLRDTIAVEKQRWMRKFDSAAAEPVELPLGPDEAPLEDGRGFPDRVCSAELTRVTVSGAVWWTVGLEASGPLHTLDASLRAGAALLAARHPPDFGAPLRASYPAWLALIIP